MSVIVLGTHDGHILVFNVPSNGRKISLRETINGIAAVVFLIIVINVSVA